jgi:hypothetical protein
LLVLPFRDSGGVEAFLCLDNCERQEFTFGSVVPGILADMAVVNRQT